MGLTVQDLIEILQECDPDAGLAIKINNMVAFLDDFEPSDIQDKFRASTCSKYVTLNLQDDRMEQIL